jgi:diguanylate cyclase (GGDEF)-like protein/PAS domain S-box-containing protein
MYERRLVIVEDIEIDPLWADYRHLALPLGLRACWSVPFENDAGTVLGAFAVYYPTSRRPSAEAEAILRDIGSSVGLAVHQDVMAQRLAHSEEHHRLVVDHLSEGIVVQSRAGVVLACNPSAQRMLRTTAQIIGRSIRTVMTRSYHEDGTLVSESDRPTSRVLATGKPILGVTIGVELVGGDVVWITENVVPIIRPGDSEPSSVLISFTDIGPVREAQQQLKFLATRDSLTGLYNRAYLTERMRDLFEPGAAAGGELASVAVLFVDLDGFKKVNDTLGHAAGDAVLVQAAARLQKSLRGNELLARLGGDEFGMLIEGSLSHIELTSIGNRLIASLAPSLHAGLPDQAVGASIGVAQSPENGSDIESLKAAADAALYESKHSGRGRVSFAPRRLVDAGEGEHVLKSRLM